MTRTASGPERHLSRHAPPPAPVDLEAEHARLLAEFTREAHLAEALAPAALALLAFLVFVLILAPALLSLVHHG